MSMFARQPAKRKTTEEAGESVPKKPKIARCKECLQNPESPDLVMYDTHPDQVMIMIVMRIMIMIMTPCLGRGRGLRRVRPEAED